MLYNCHGNLIEIFLHKFQLHDSQHEPKRDLYRLLFYNGRKRTIIKGLVRGFLETSLCKILQCRYVYWHLKLMEGYKYDFVISMIPEGKNKIYLRSWGYSYPFDNTKGGTHLSNSFTYSLDISFIHLNGGYAEMSEWENITFTRPNIDRYHGELNGYIPFENSQVLVEMKRVVIVNDNTISNGVDISKENIPMTEGDQITIDTNKGADTEITPQI